MKRVWRITLPGRGQFTMILMGDDKDALSVARSIWPDATVE